MDVDLCFVIDCTGKEKKCVKILIARKSVCLQLCRFNDRLDKRMQERYPKYCMLLLFLFFLNNKANKCHFRDYDDIPQFEVLDFTENIDEFKDFLGKLKATGGGDDCEDVIGGLEKCVGLTWSSKTKVLFHIVKPFWIDLFKKDEKK
ncbi:hypothetical protein RFI_38743 [Reticulomyxa filosa]|uniref:Uncharacterized protein n=1 Tax=Reticulomyxa filosa TaxID=46433 RepID=X6L9M4_RETFI|nr:hypothetical protein RFI_38743 [Reticulomyxa filosa]|eukprot:ETN98747.1 hypothetical protein RFI_38743 [Reticulomyxa filosa]